MGELEALKTQIDNPKRPAQARIQEQPRPGTQQLARGNLDQLNWTQLLGSNNVAPSQDPSYLDYIPGQQHQHLNNQYGQDQSIQYSQDPYNQYGQNKLYNQNQINQAQTPSAPMFDVSDLQSFDPNQIYQQPQQQQPSAPLQVEQTQPRTSYGLEYLGIDKLPQLDSNYKPFQYQSSNINDDIKSKHQILPKIQGGYDAYGVDRESYEKYFPNKKIEYPQLPKWQEEEEKKKQEEEKQRRKESGKQQGDAPFVPPNVLLNGQEMEVQNVPLSAVKNQSASQCCDNGSIKDVQKQVVKAQAQPPSSNRAEYVSKQGEFRYVYISLGVLSEFLKFARVNTSKGIEFCGVLCGTLASDDSSFNLSAIIIPKQKGTQNTVEMENEEELFDILEQNSYFPLGWIHTHPTQTCFLSSIDVHTQLSWQLLIDEAMAIVMAPQDTKQKCGIFRLTTPGGLDLIKDCQERGFHTHPDTKTGQDIYELCGHVYLSEKVKHQVHDLR